MECFDILKEGRRSVELTFIGVKISFLLVTLEGDLKLFICIELADGEFGVPKNDSPGDPKMGDFVTGDRATGDLVIEEREVGDLGVGDF